MNNDQRSVPIDIPSDQFRAIGHKLVDEIADFLQQLPSGPLTSGESPSDIRKVLGQDSLPETGYSPEKLLDEVAPLLFQHSLFNGHPKFWGYITSSPAPIGSLADFLAAAVNPNVGSFSLAPVATEIEAQTIRWIAELIGYPTSTGGILVSGGNMANFVGFLAARKAKIPWDVRKDGMASSSLAKVRVYATSETHTWIKKAVDLFGLGENCICWIETDANQRMDVGALRSSIQSDISHGNHPLMVIGTAGTVATGAVDPLPEIAKITREYKMWFHVDGAYGALAAALDNLPSDIKGLSLADSVAVDPHKWLYSPLEVGCALVRDPSILHDTFHHNVSYYRFGGDPSDEPTNYYEYGMQNSRGFRALKVWLALRQVGRQGVITMIDDDIKLSRAMFDALGRHREIERFTQNLSIATFRYRRTDIGNSREDFEYLNQLNTELLSRLQRGGKAYVSNAMLQNVFLLRACIVNFQTTFNDVQELPEIIVQLGREVDRELRQTKDIGRIAQ